MSGYEYPLVVVAEVNQDGEITGWRLGGNGDVPPDDVDEYAVWGANGWEPGAPHVWLKAAAALEGMLPRTRTDLPEKRED